MGRPEWHATPARHAPKSSPQPPLSIARGPRRARCKSYQGRKMPLGCRPNTASIRSARHTRTPHRYASDVDDATRQPGFRQNAPEPAQCNITLSVLLHLVPKHSQSRKLPLTPGQVNLISIDNLFRSTAHRPRRASPYIKISCIGPFAPQWSWVPSPAKPGRFAVYDETPGLNIFKRGHIDVQTDPWLP